jgi:hypothetical protein
MVKHGRRRSRHFLLCHLLGPMLTDVLQDALQLPDPLPQVGLDLLDRQCLHERKGDVNRMVVALYLAPRRPQQPQKLGPSGVGDLVDGARRAAALLLDGDLFDKSFLREFAQRKIDRAKGDIGPIAHVLFDDLFDLVAVQRLFT